MSLIKWEPFGDIDRFFEEGILTFPKFGRDLAVDVYEKENNIIAEMNLTGIDPEKIDVSVKDNYLHISSSREESKEEKKKHYYSKEISRGSFERVVYLPDAVQKDKIKAEFKDGELTITMPKVATTQKSSDKIKVRVKK